MRFEFIGNDATLIKNLLDSIVNINSRDASLRDGDRVTYNIKSDLEIFPIADAALIAALNLVASRLIACQYMELIP